MKYLYSVVFSAIMAVIAPLGFSALIIDSEPVIIPNIGFTALAQLSPAEAKEYLKEPNNYEELTGIRKYIHFTFTDNEYLPYVLAFPFIIAFISAMFGIWVGLRSVRT